MNFLKPTGLKNDAGHLAIYITGDTNKDKVIHQILNDNLLKDHLALDTLQGELYSVLRLKELIDEEIRHEHIEIRTSHSLAALSEGEQKKALLQYIISKRPEYILVDNLLDSLDKASQASIQATLEALSATTLIIQVVNRTKDILPFIRQLYSVEQEALVYHADVQRYIAAVNEKSRFDFPGAIPPAMQAYVLPAGPLLQLKNVSVQYDERPIVTNINWTVQAGEFWQLIGPNGSGKTTLLSMISGDNTKAYGQDMVLFGIKKGTGETVWDIKKNIGYFTNAMTHLFSRDESIENMIVSGFLDSVGLYTVPSDMQRMLAQQWLKLIGLYEVRHKSFRSFSQGHQRLILIVRAMVKHPPLLILDEPTSGVDDYHVSMITTFINKIAAESQTAILYVSHRTEETLAPQFMLELIPGENGSVGIIH